MRKEKQAMATENERMVNEFCKTWETLNIDKVMDFFTDDAVYHNIPLKPSKGKAEIRKAIDGFMPGMTKIEFKILTTASAGTRGLYHLHHFFFISPHTLHVLTLSWWW